MASCTNKNFIVIYIRKSSGEIKVSISTCSLNSAEFNRTCTVEINITTILATDVLCRFNFYTSNYDTKYIMTSQFKLFLLYFMSTIELIGFSK